MTRPESTRGRKQPAQEESIYNILADSSVHVGPKLKLHEQPPSVEAGLYKPKPRMHQDSSQVDSLFNPIRGVRDAQQRAGITPTDHAKANKRAIRQQSNINAIRKLEDQGAEANGGSNARRPPGAPAGAKARRSGGGAADEGRNFVRQNILDAGARTKADAPPKKDGSEFLHKNGYGRVPLYLHERKMELAANYARAMAEKEAALIPDGMRMMSEDERLETLEILQNNREEVEKAMQRLPFVIETPSQIRHKNQLERRIQEIEEARKIFSRPKVLVKI